MWDSKEKQIARFMYSRSHQKFHLLSSHHFSLLLSLLCHGKILTSNRIRCVSIMWSRSSQTNSCPLGEQWDGKDLVSPLHPKGIQMLGHGERNPQKERWKCRQMERESHFVQRYQVSRGQHCLHPHCDEFQNNSTAGHFARLLIKTWKVPLSVYHVRYAAACQNVWVTEEAIWNLFETDFESSWPQSKGLPFLLRQLQLVTNSLSLWFLNWNILLFKAFSLIV